MNSEMNKIALKAEKVSEEYRDKLLEILKFYLWKRV